MMKFLQVMIISLSFLLLVRLQAVESSSSDNNLVSTITRGSSLSLNDTTSPYWLSPSGNIAFGFYRLPWSPNQYDVGIWFAKSPHKTLVWTANHILPLHKPSSILFTKEGKLVIRILPDNKEKPLLPDAAEPVSYARLHDNANFVLYGSDSQIVWESFDHPTDTILGGQKLILGVDHLISNSGEYQLSNTRNGVVIVSNAYDTTTAISTYHWAWPPATPPATLNLDTTGKLYLVNSDGSVRETIYEDKNQQQKLQEDGTGSNVKEDYIYRATLDSRGYFILYKERIDGNSGDSLVLLWASYEWIVSILIFVVLLLPLGIVGAVVVDLKKNGWDLRLVVEEWIFLVEEWIRR